MIIIIHGDDIAKSRSFFLDLKNKEKDTLTFSFEKLTITDLVQNIEGSGLFNDTKTIAIEELLTKGKKKDAKSKEILEFLTKNSKNSDFILWESKEITKKELAQFKNARINLFKLPKNIFLFLDNLKPNNSKNLLNLFHQALENEIKEELILFMLQRQFRILLAISEKGERQIEEVNRLSWQLPKLNAQAKQFTIQELKEIYKKLYEIEKAQKTGTLSKPLSNAIDFLLLEM